MAIADDHRLRRIRMPPRHFADEGCLGARDIRQGLARKRVPSEGNKINRVTGRQGHTNLAVILETTNPGTMARARINDDIRALRLINADAFRGPDLQQHIIAGPRERRAIQGNLIIIDQDRRTAFLFMRDEDIAPLAQRIHGEHQTLGPVAQIFKPKAERLLRAARN